MTEAEVRADERKRIADFVSDFSWTLPLYGNFEDAEERERYRLVNEATDDAACAVCNQIAAAILAMT